MFEDKTYADNVVIAVEKQIHYASNENLARDVGQTIAEDVPEKTATEHHEKTIT